MICMCSYPEDAGAGFLVTEGVNRTHVRMHEDVASTIPQQDDRSDRRVRRTIDTEDCYQQRDTSL
jgi:hypothetical protein